jgi:hypothetical protein
MPSELARLPLPSETWPQRRLAWHLFVEQTNDVLGFGLDQCVLNQTIAVFDARRTDATFNRRFLLGTHGRHFPLGLGRRLRSPFRAMAHREIGLGDGCKFNSGGSDMTRHAITTLLSSGMLAFLAGASGGLAQSAALKIPQSLDIEHHEIFEALDAATKSGGKTAEAASKAMLVLKPHFAKEEKFALPQLGALEMLTRTNSSLAGDVRDDLIARSEKFRAELPAMLDEHKQISSALHEMAEAAEAERKTEVAKLAEKIMAHAQMEESVLYPASLLTGVAAQAKSR